MRFRIDSCVSIRVVFSITDLNNVEQDPDKYDDRALYDEDEEGLDGMDGQSGGAQSKGAITSGQTKNGNINVAPENRVAPADRQELADDESAAAEDGSGEDAEPSFPARVNITVSKPGKGSLQIETVAQDGSIIIESVYYYSDPSLAEPKTPEHELARRDLYLGPPFGNLDEDLQVILERYLDERGINTALALFIPDYVDYKEQKEYLRWLSSKEFPLFSFSFSFLSLFFFRFLFTSSNSSSFFYRELEKTDFSFIHRCQVLCRVNPPKRKPTFFLKKKGNAEEGRVGEGRGRRWGLKVDKASQTLRKRINTLHPTPPHTHKQIQIQIHTLSLSLLFSCMYIYTEWQKHKIFQKLKLILTPPLLPDRLLIKTIWRKLVCVSCYSHPPLCTSYSIRISLPLSLSHTHIV